MITIAALYVEPDGCYVDQSVGIANGAGASMLHA